MAEHKLESIDKVLVSFGTFTISVVTVLGSKNQQGKRNDPVYVNKYESEKYEDVSKLKGMYLGIQTYLKFKISYGREDSAYISFAMLDALMLTDIIDYIYMGAFDDGVFFEDEKGAIYLNASVPEEDRTWYIEGLGNRTLILSYHINDEGDTGILFNIDGITDFLGLEAFKLIGRLIEKTDLVTLSTVVASIGLSEDKKSFDLKRRSV